MGTHAPFERIYILMQNQKVRAYMYRDIRGVQNLGSTIWGKDFVGNSQHAAKEPNCPVSPGRKESKNIWIHQPVKRSAIKPHLSVYVGFCALVGPEGVMLPCLFPSAMPAKFKVQSTKTYGSSVTINLLAQSITVLASAQKRDIKKNIWLFQSLAYLQKQSPQDLRAVFLFDLFSTRLWGPSSCWKELIFAYRFMWWTCLNARM